MNLNNKHAVVTGGGTGVGAETALKLANNLAKVTIIGRKEKNLKNISSKHENINWHVCDVSKSEDLKECYKTIRKKNGNISIVIANAGISFSKPFHKTTTKDLTEIININLIGVFNSFKFALNDMKSNNWGRMIAMSSTAGLKGYSYVSAYCASKHAVIGLTRSLSIELASKNITVNSICPSYVDTPMTERTIKNITDLTNLNEVEAIKKLTETNPQKKLVKPSEISESILWLCNDNSSSINGQNISLSGGEI